MKFRVLVLVTVWLGCGLTTAANGTAEAAEADKLNVCYSSIAATSITTWVPKEAGIYKKHGLDVNIIYVAGAQAITTLISGDTHIVQGSGAAAVLSRLSGSDVIMIGTTINVIPMSLVTTPDVNGPQDLKGKTFGVSRFGSLTDLGLRKALSEFGLDASKDIKMIQTGGVPENLLFMQQGMIKGALISTPTLERAKELGYKELINLGEIKYRYPGTALVTTDSFIRGRPQTVNRFLKATLEGIKYAKANPDFTIRVLGKYTRNSDTKRLALLRVTSSDTSETCRLLLPPRSRRRWKISLREIRKRKERTRNSFMTRLPWSSLPTKDSSKSSTRASDVAVANFELRLIRRR